MVRRGTVTKFEKTSKSSIEVTVSMREFCGKRYSAVMRYPAFLSENALPRYQLKQIVKINNE